MGIEFPSILSSCIVVVKKEFRIYFFFDSSDSFNAFMSLDDDLLQVQDLIFAMISFNMIRCC